MEKNNYKQHIISNIKDVDDLIEIIHQHGCFTQKDYERCRKQAENSKFPTRLLLKLKKYVKPLIGACSKRAETLTNNINSLNEDRNETQSTEKQNISPFDKTYKASDFIIEDGYIQLGNMKLKSVRIAKVHPSWLVDIYHEFTIASDYERPGQFHFVPYTDLSFLLDAIDIQIKEENRRINQKKFDGFKLKLPQLINEYISSFLNRIDIFTYNQLTHQRFFDLLKRTNVLSEDVDFETFKSMLHENNVRIPVEDIEVEDDWVTIRTQNLSFSRDMTFDDFFSEYEYCLNSFTNKLDKIKEVFTETVHSFCQSVRAKEIIKIKTHLSKVSFYEAFLNQERVKSTSFSYELCKVTHFYFPIEFLFHDENDGVSLLTRTSFLAPFNLNLVNLYDLITSELFSFSEKIKGEFELLLTNMPHELKNEHSSSWLDKEPYARKVTNFHLQHSPICFYRERITKALVFTENCSHYSDYDTWGKSTETHKSYLLIDEDYGCITLCPTDRKYSNYVFRVDTRIVHLDLASYVIIKYFSSCISNKRQSFKITDTMKYFGINSFYKY